MVPRRWAQTSFRLEGTPSDCDVQQNPQCHGNLPNDIGYPGHAGVSGRATQIRDAMCNKRSGAVLDWTRAPECFWLARKHQGRSVVYIASVRSLGRQHGDQHEEGHAQRCKNCFILYESRPRVPTYDRAGHSVDNQRPRFTVVVLATFQRKPRLWLSKFPIGDYPVAASPTIQSQRSILPSTTQQYAQDYQN